VKFFERKKVEHYIVTLSKLELLREKNKYLHEEAHAITFSMNIPKHLQAEN
jgi:hypothetical protein